VLRSDGDGTQSRDLIYVDDVVEANVLSAVCDSKFCGRSYNIATGTSTSNNSILAQFDKEFENVNIEPSPWRAGDVMHTLACVKKATKELSFVSKVGLSEGLSHTWSWWRKVAADNEL